MLKVFSLCLAVCSLSLNSIDDTTCSKMYEVQDFSYLTQSTTFNPDLIELHLTLYQGYVKNTNLLLNELEKLADDGENRSYEYGALKRRLGWEFDGMRLHELYFENMSNDSAVKKDSSFYKAIEKNFGSFDAWKQDFIATGMMRGIGWVILYQDPASGKLINTWVNEHDTGHLATSEALLVMDVWEHAYLTQFGLDREKYIQTFFENIAWKVVEERFKVKNQRN